VLVGEVCESAGLLDQVTAPLLAVAVKQGPGMDPCDTVTVCDGFSATVTGGCADRIEISRPDE
jgi:hypothetical protein